MEPDLNSPPSIPNEKMTEGHKVIKPSPGFNPKSAESGTPPCRLHRPKRQ